ncbi:glycosyltransferase [Olsenella sp. SW781]|uniref:glycosyltransferase n=1 Tax=Olsenella sp. SW781 TaxID=2530046 RepID=UPI0014397022|nr:glycosyltransferase [Olsenella sp. SW781]
MNPVIVIPSYWAEGAQPGALGERGVYDYTTPIDKPLPELELCLSSLDQVRGVIRVIVLVVSPITCEDSARARVESICRAHPALNPLVIGAREAAHVERAVARMAHHVTGETVALRGYGAIKNMGLAVAAVFGHDVVVFLDDDEVVLDPDFLINAVHGLGSLTRQNLKVLVKSGFFIDANNSPYADPTDEWTEKYWSKAAEFNRVMERMQTSSSRFSRSNHLCGGCCALHAEAYSKVPFDPYITRGEDLDYVLNLRANGMDAWFDNAWFVRSQPPEEMASVPSMFMQDVHRWLYEYRKLDAMNARRDLRTITPESLMPYPAPWLSAGVRRRVFQTALRRFIKGPNRLAYLRILTKGRYDADKFARAASSRYLSFSMMWPGVVAALWEDPLLQGAIRRTGEIVPPEERAAAATDDLGDTGALPTVGDAQ